MLICSLSSSILLAQDYKVSGKVTDANLAPLSFVNVLVHKEQDQALITGTTTNEDGSFSLKDLEEGDYLLVYSYIGYQKLEQPLHLSSSVDLGTVVLQPAHQSLEETVITAKLPTIKKNAGKLTFMVENTSLSVGSTMDLLKKTPGVVVIGNSIRVKFSSPVIYINGKRVYLSESEVISLLENTDAANIKSVEVITNPSAQYDADAGTVLNIITSKAISVGYKGTVNGNYEQAIYPKYTIGSSHFYKNNWLNLYASYSYNNLKKFKDEDGHIRFFEADEVSTKSFWETDFNRTTRSRSHTGNLVMDFNLDQSNTLNFTSNISIVPKETFHNNGKTFIYGPSKILDSTRTTRSNVEFEKDNLTFALDYTRKFNEGNASWSTSANYIYYKKNQEQTVETRYQLPNNTFLGNDEFYTDSRQLSNIFTAQSDLSTTLWSGNLDTGVKFSNIDTDSKLDFFNITDSGSSFNNALSDDFNYIENIYAAYLSFKGDWGKWSLSAGMRGEYTDIDAISRSLGQVNSQGYFDIFPTASAYYTVNDSHSIGISYDRSITRPRYQSLNPFKYFITENNYNAGNPKLVPAIGNRMEVGYTYRNKLFFKAYYENIDNKLTVLNFQDNENSMLRGVDSNIIREYQYSFDITYFESLFPWWWFHITTSSFYMADEFWAVESTQDKYKNDTFGQYIQTYSNFALLKDRSLVADLTTIYFSNIVSGSVFYKNQFVMNISFRKELWNKRASISLGIDDVANTNNIPIVTKYYNQDMSYFPKPESRIFRLGFKYNFGNARLRDNHKEIITDEGERLEGK